MPDPRVPPSCPPNGFLYTVVPGDTMFVISIRFGVNINTLIAANPQISNPNLIFPGDVLCIPGAIPPNTRVPTSCRPGFSGRYTVQPGDTMFSIAQLFRTRVEALIVNNPQITNPNLIFPGDVLCVPGQVPFPCATVMNPVVPVPLGTIGAALVHINSVGLEAVSFVATLPPPATFGNFDIYIATANIPDVGGFGAQLFPTPEEPPTFAGTNSIPTVTQLTPDTTVIVQPFNTTIGVTGPTILQGTLNTCQGQPFSCGS